MVRTALAILTIAVAVAATGAVLQAVPSPARSVGPALAAPTIAEEDAAGVLRVAAGSTGVAAETRDDDGSGPFTLQELHDGDVAPERFAAFWDAELDRVRAAPCPAPTAPGSTVVVAHVGATPPPHLGDDYLDYAPLLAEARAAATADC